MAVFFAGILSFLSPCILPLVPVYVADLSGSLPSADSHSFQWRTLAKTLLFVAGFSAVFIVLGATAGAVGSLTLQYQWLWQKVAGVILVIFGVHLLGILNIPFLNYEKRFIKPRPGIPGPVKSFVMGAAFSSGWTPCVGPVLSGVLALAMSSQTAGQGAFFMAVFSLGLAVPFVVIGFLLGKFTTLVHRMNKFVRVVSVLSGALVISIGLVIFFDLSYAVNGALNQYLPGWRPGF